MSSSAYMQTQEKTSYRCVIETEAIETATTIFAAPVATSNAAHV